MSKLWKCYNCETPIGVIGYDFESDVPVCPKCGLDGRDPVMASRMTERVVIHFDPPHPIMRGRGINKRACDGKPIHGGYAVGEPANVTCPECKTSDAFLKVTGGEPPKVVVPDGHDFVIGEK